MQSVPSSVIEEANTGVMEASGNSAIAKRLWHIVRAVYYMLRKDFSKRKLMMELHLLLKRGKIAGKALGNLMFHHHDSHQPHHYSSSGGSGSYYAAFSCRSMDPNLSYYNPREVEFSCSNTPSYPFHLNKRKRHHRSDYSYHYDVDTVRKALEIISSQVPESPDVATPSPAPFWGFGKSPLPVRQLRISDSPFPIEEVNTDPQVDRQAEEFIQRFYEQLRNQQRTPASLHSRYRGQAVYG